MTGFFSSPLLTLMTTVSLILPLEGCAFLPADNAEWVQSVYGAPLAESEAVENSWFEDSAFVGHSLIQGFAHYGGLSEADYYYLPGSSVETLLTSSAVTLPDGESGRLWSEISQHTYQNVYLMMGINEIAGNLEALKSDYQALIEMVRDSQPEADIYVLSVLPVTRSKDGEGTFTLERIEAYNEMLLELCGEQSCWYVDLFECFADKNGYLPDAVSTDGVHLREEAYMSMLNYLCTHTAQ